VTAFQKNYKARAFSFVSLLKVSHSIFGQFGLVDNPMTRCTQNYNIFGTPVLLITIQMMLIKSITHCLSADYAVLGLTESFSPPFYQQRTNRFTLYLMSFLAPFDIVCMQLLRCLTFSYRAPSLLLRAILTP
jgi:hypothetical protein